MDSPTSRRSFVLAQGAGEKKPAVADARCSSSGSELLGHAHGDVPVAAAAAAAAAVGGDRTVGRRSSSGGSSGPGAASRRQFLEAMAGLPDETKAAYAEAAERAPPHHLVEAESCPDAYLEHHRLDPWRAALAVAEYWRFRAETFGADRAYLPLTLAGGGAMSPDDVKVFKTGFLMVLPDDRRGRAVLFHDRARLATPDEMDGGRRLRCLFYALSVLAESESARQNGVVIVSALSKNTRRAALELDLCSKGLALLRSGAFPFGVAEGHLAIAEDRPLLSAFATLVLGVAEKLNVLKGKIVVHNSGGRSGSGSLLQRLNEHGFDTEGIPTVPLGGLFSFGCFRAWVDDRIRSEAGDPRRRGAGAPPPTSPGGGGAAVAEEDEEELTRKKKRIDAAYCRRKRFKKKIEGEVMRAEAERLRQQNGRLKEHGDALETCLRDARRAVARHEALAGETGRSALSNSSRGRRPGGDCPQDLDPGYVYEARGPSVAGATHATTNESTGPQPLYSIVGGASNRLPPTHPRLGVAPGLLNANYAMGMPNLSFFCHTTTRGNQGPSVSALEAARFSDLVSDALLQNHGHRSRLIAASSMADSSRSHSAAFNVRQAPRSAEPPRQVQSRDPVDPAELALLEMCGRLGGPPRLF